MDEKLLPRVSFAVRARRPWLEVNLATAFLAAAVVGLFESSIRQFTALAVLLPVVAGQSGNTGAQALAVTMRGLALREIRVSQWPRIVRKEAMVAFINGWAVALTTAAGVMLWSGSPGLSLVIGSSSDLDGGGGTGRRHHSDRAHVDWSGPGAPDRNLATTGSTPSRNPWVCRWCSSTRAARRAR